MKELVSITIGETSRSGWDPDDFNDSCVTECPGGGSISCGKNAIFCVKIGTDASNGIMLSCLYESGSEIKTCPGVTLPDSGDSGWEPDWGSGDDSGDNSGDSGGKTRHEGKGKRL